MSNQVPSRKVFIGDQEYTLQFNLLAMEAFKQETGINPLTHGLEGALDGPRTLAVLVCALANGPKNGLTVDDVLEKVHYVHLPVLVDAIIELYQQFMPDAPADAASEESAGEGPSSPVEVVETFDRLPTPTLA